MFKYLYIILCVKAIAVIGLILYGPLHLDPEEAQYWLWSQNLDWGYYSKPPGISWLISGGTFLFGNTEIGVRIGAVLFSFWAGLGMFLLSRRAGLSEKASFWAAIVFAFSPLGIADSIFSTTDVGLLLFLILAFAVALRQNFILLGICVLCGALFKWTMFVIWIPLIAYACYEKKWRTLQFAVAILISLLAFIPSLIWNSQHDWVTFKHVWKQSTGGEAPNSNPIGFLSAQIALLSPFFFILWIASFFKIKKAPHFVGLFSYLCLGILLVYFIFSFFHKIQGNWAIYALPLGMMAIAWYAKRSLPYMTGLSLLMVIILIALIPIIPLKLNPLKTTLGWNALPKVLEQVGYHPEENFLVSDKYQTSSLLSFYSKEQKRAYFLNLFSRRKNQFSFWPTLSQEQFGKSGFFVAIDEKNNNNYQQRLAPYFKKVRFLGFFPLYKNERSAMIFHCADYNGDLPKDPDIY